MDTKLIPLEIQEKVKSDVKALLEGATIEKIETAEQFQNAGELKKQIKKKYNEFEDTRKGLVTPHNNDVKKINDYFREPKEQIEDLADNIDKVMLDFEKEQEQKRIEEQRKADEQAKKERERIEEQARQKREKEAEERRKAEEAKRKASEAKNEEERKKAEADARKAERAADKAAEQADAKESIANTTVAPIVQTQAPKVKGRSTRKDYKAEVTDKVAFIKWCVETNQFAYIDINESALNRIVKGLKMGFQAPGIKVVEDTITMTRAA